MMRKDPAKERCGDSDTEAADAPTRDVAIRGVAPAQELCGLHYQLVRSVKPFGDLDDGRLRTRRLLPFLRSKKPAQEDHLPASRHGDLNRLAFRDRGEGWLFVAPARSLPDPIATRRARNGQLPADLG